MKKNSFTLWVEKAAEKKEADGKKRTAQIYRQALHSLRLFLGDRDIGMKDVTASLMESYEAWLQGKGLSRNTTSFYMRPLRTAWGRAVEEGLAGDSRPFRRVYTGVEKTRHRAVTIDTVRAMMRLDLREEPSLRYARDMFLLSFYLRGMPPVDMYNLRVSSLRGGVVVYRRRKTNQRLAVRWTAEMNEIARRYSRNPDYLLPMVGEGEKAGERQFRNVCNRITHGLHVIGARMGLDHPLTMYVARHTWATAARELGVKLSVISRGLGHDNELTTQVYLASIDTSEVDRANEMIIRACGKK